MSYNDYESAKASRPKRLISVFLAIATLITLIIPLSGCALTPLYWRGLTRPQCESYVLYELKKKYNEDFKVLDFIHTGSGELKGVCVPVRDESLRFDIAIGLNDKYDLRENYPQGIVRKQMIEQTNSVLTKYYDNYALEIYVYGLTYTTSFTSASDVSIKTFSENCRPSSLSVMWVALDKGERILKKEEMEQIAKEFTSGFYGFKTMIYFYFVDDNVIDECLNEIELNRIKTGNKVIDHMEVILSPHTPFYKYRYKENEVEFLQERL